MNIKTSNLLRWKIIVVLIFTLAFNCRVFAEDEVDKLRQEVRELSRIANPFVQIFQKVSKLVGPSVVSIISENASKTSSDPHDTPPSPFTLPEKGNQETPRTQRPSFGSGIIVKRTGYILTNLHVIDGFEDKRITVTLHNGEQYDAEVVGKDPSTDLAILKIACDNLREAFIGDSRNVRVGDWVIAIGNPFGYSQTVSSGIVSAVGRTNITPFPKPFAYENFIQTDAAINPGNSGGPLVNMLGEVIGINSAIATRTGGFQGVGFAISSNIANEVIHDLIEKGRVVRGYLGVGIQNIDDKLASYLNFNNMQEVLKRFELDSNKGAFLSEIWSDTPASRGGIHPGDVIIEFGGQEINNANDLQNAIRISEVDSKVNLKVIRNKKEKLLIVKIDEQPKSMSGKTFTTIVNHLSHTSASTGLTVETLTTVKAEELGYEAGRGVLVIYVENGSSAERVGIVPGDLILKVGPKDIHSVNDFKSAVKKCVDKGLSISALIRSSSITFFKVMKP